jgi:orotate phosphoribosyltransferase
MARRVARDIVGLGLVRIGDFKLSGGGRSRVYIDLRSYPMHPPEFRAALEELTQVIRGLRGYDRNTVLAGVATGGIPWAIGASLLLGVPATYVRPEPKGHGTSRLVEAEVAGRRVVVVDDVATTGGSLASAVEALRGAGADVIAAVAVVDRGQGAAERLSAIGVPLYSVTTLEEVLRELASRRPGDPQLLSALEEVGLA